jgi:LIM domain kinase 1
LKLDWRLCLNHSDHSTDSGQPLIDSPPSIYSDYSTTVIRQHSPRSNTPPLPSLSSILTIRASPNLSETQGPNPLPADDRNTETSTFSIESYHTAHSSMALSMAAATEGGSTIRGMPSTLVHRFTLLKPGAKRASGSATPPQRPSSADVPWNPFDLIFSSGLLTAKCDICHKRLGWKPVLECDDCGLRYSSFKPDFICLTMSSRTHIKCGELAPRDCGLHPGRRGSHSVFYSISGFPSKATKAK